MANKISRSKPYVRPGELLEIEAKKLASRLGCTEVKVHNGMRYGRLNGVWIWLSKRLYAQEYNGR